MRLLAARECANNLKQIGLAMANYVTANKTFPRGVQEGCYQCEPWAWSALILPFMEEQQVYEQLVLANAPTQAPNANKNYNGPTQLIITTYLCPSTALLHPSRDEKNHIGDVLPMALQPDGVTYLPTPNNRWDPGEGLAVSDYCGIQGPSRGDTNSLNGKTYDYNQGVLLNIGDQVPDHVRLAPKVGPKQITDGLSKTMLISEITGRGYNPKKSSGQQFRGVWADGGNVIAINDPPNTWPGTEAWVRDELYADHKGGVNGLFCDGSVHFISDGIDRNVLYSICTRASDDPITPGAF